MALGVVKLSETGRNRLAVLFTIISIAMFVTSVLLVINSIYITFVIAPNIRLEKATITLIFTVIAMLATQLSIYYISGIFICKKCHIESYKKNSRYLLRIWAFSGYTSIFNVVVIGTMAASVSNHLLRSMHYSMERGMRLYLEDLQWKKTIDSLQFSMQCCGFSSYKDWHAVSWMSAIHVINSSEIIKTKFPISGTHLYLPAVPWSCCKLNYAKQCFHDPIQQYQYLNDWDHLSAASVYNIGCVELLRWPIECSFLIFILATYLLLFLQITLTITSRYIYTSSKNAVILGDPFGIAPGWIFGRGDFGYQGGPTAHEIMHGIGTHSSPSSSLVEEQEEYYDARDRPRDDELYRSATENDEMYRSAVEDDDYRRIRAQQEALMMR